MSIAENIEKVRQNIKTACERSGRNYEDVTILGVTKTVGVDDIMCAVNEGICDLGENRVQEFMEKYDKIPNVKWHIIGHLQTNKIKYIVPYVALIHGIDSYKLLVEVNKQAEKAGKVVNCLLQLHIAEEETKFGFSFDECRDMLAEGEWKTLSNIQLCGLMGMATNTDDNEQIKKEFCSLSSFFKEVKDSWFADTEAFRELSMGMSHDYHQAIAAGSTLIRVGSKIFGDRTY